jgi:hypothetical protein
MFFFFPMNLIQVQGYTPTAAGAASLPLIALIFLLSRLAGGLVTAMVAGDLSLSDLSLRQLASRYLQSRLSVATTGRRSFRPS